MSIGSIARDMKTRMPWDVGKRILALNDVARGHGWERTVDRLAARETELAAHADDLTTALTEHYLVGEKLVRFYELSRQEISDLRSKLSSKRTPRNDFSDVYPTLLDEAKIEESYPHEHVLAHVHKGEDGIAAVFASSRAIFVREPIHVEDLSGQLATRLSEYDEIYGVKLVKYQAMDVVWVPHTGIMIDVRIDFPRGMHHDQALAAQEATRKAFRELCNEEVLTSPVNLFPLIDAIYKEPNEGNVVELAFGTTTASLKHEKMRRASADLRQELYHKGGKRALKTSIEPYRLGVEYSVTLGSIISLPELSLNGTSRMTGSTNPTLHEVTIRKCLGIADYEYVRSSSLLKNPRHGESVVI